MFSFPRDKKQRTVCPDITSVLTEAGGGDLVPEPVVLVVVLAVVLVMVMVDDLKAVSMILDQRIMRSKNKK